MDYYPKMDGDYIQRWMEEIESRLYRLENEVEVHIETVDGGMVPEFAHPTDVGMDLSSNEELTLIGGETKLVHTGIKVAIPEGYELQIRPRSGLSLKTSLRVANSPGTIDPGYRDEICVIMTNQGFDPITIRVGDRIAQMVLSKVLRPKFVPVDDVSNIGEDRGGGFGSTGV